MAGIPTNFQAISNVLANYDFVDIVAGTGFINFYAGRTVDLNLLSNFQFYCDTIFTKSAALSKVDTKMLDIDFDVLLNRPLDVKGIGILNVPLRLEKDLTPATVSAYVIAKLRKWDGVTETDIVTNTSRTATYDGSLSEFSMLAIDLNTPLTHFKIGEYIRLTLEIYGSYSSAGTSSGQFVSVGHDPKGRTAEFDTTGAVSSSTILQCPVRLNL